MNICNQSDMDSSIRHIIFDFDGTLADTSPVILATMQATIVELGLPSKTETECRATIGLRLEDIPSALWPDKPGISATYAATYRRIFDEKKKDLRTQSYPGVIEGLKQLHKAGYSIAVASSRSHKSVEEYLRYFGIAELFADIIGVNDVKNGKPSPDPVFAVCAHTGWSPEECLVVGDAIYDIEMGHNAGTHTCAVTYGNQSRAELETARPDRIVNSFYELIRILCSTIK